MAAYSGWGLAEFWKARKDFPRQKWARKSLPGKWTRGHEGTEGSLSAGSQGPVPGCWQIRLGGQGAVTQDVVRHRNSHSPETFFLCAFLTLSLLGKLFLSLIPGAFLLIFQDPAPRPAPPCSTP